MLLKWLEICERHQNVKFELWLLRNDVTRLVLGRAERVPQIKYVK